MLYADKLALANQARVRMLEIREREVELYVRNSRALSLQCAALAGVAQQAMVYTKFGYFQNASRVAQGFYAVSIGSLLGLGILGVFVLTLTAMLGPGLALRGPNGSMHIAIDAIVAEYRQGLLLYGGALTVFHGLLLSYAWGDFDWVLTKVGVTVVGVCSYSLVVRHAWKVVGFYHSDELHSGAFQPLEDPTSTADARGMFSQDNGVPRERGRAMH